MSSVAINLSGLAGAINDVINILIQYMPLFITMGVLIGLVQFVVGGFGNLFNGITSIFSGA